MVIAVKGVLLDRYGTANFAGAPQARS